MTDVDTQARNLRVFAWLFLSCPTALVATYVLGATFDGDHFLALYLLLVFATPAALAVAAWHAWRLDAPVLLRGGYAASVLLVGLGAAGTYLGPLMAAGNGIEALGIILVMMVYLVFATTLAFLFGLVLLGSAAVRLRRARKGFQFPVGDEYGLAGR